MQFTVSSAENDNKENLKLKSLNKISSYHIGMENQESYEEENVKYPLNEKDINNNERYEYMENYMNNYGNGSEIYDEKGKKKRYEYLYDLDKKQREIKEIMKKTLDEERQNDINCTFKPQIFSNNNQFNGKFDKDTNVIDRNKVWLEQKESKLKKIRKNDENKDLVECTFQPLTTNTGVSYRNINISTANTFELSKGIDKFLKRQIVARHNKEEKEAKLNNPYSHIKNDKINWNNHRVTVPQEFNLGKPNKNNRRIEFEDNKNFTKNDEEIDNDLVYVSDVTFGEAVNYLHSELHRIDLTLD